MKKNGMRVKMLENLLGHFQGMPQPKPEKKKSAEEKAEKTKGGC